MFIRPRWRKVLRDFWRNRTRSLLVVASIAIGVFALGTVLHLQILILGAMQQDYHSASAASAILSTEGINEETVNAIRRLPTVAAAEGRASLEMEVLVGPDQWKKLNLTAFNNFDQIQVNKVLRDPAATAQLGAPPPDTLARPLANRDLLLERSSLARAGLLPANLRLGDRITVRILGNRLRELRLVSLAYEPNREPANVLGTANGYVTLDTLVWLGGTRDYKELQLQVRGNLAGTNHISAVAKVVEERLKKSGYRVYATTILDPGRLPLQDIFETLGILLAPLSIGALLLSSFLVINMISALLAQQVRQIGVMKAIGARNGQIMQMYLTFVLICGLLALALAMPLGMVTASLLAKYIAGYVNITLHDFTLPPTVILFEVMIGGVTPVLAALYPVRRGTGVTVHEAIADYGLGSGQTQRSLADRLLSRLPLLSRPLLISLRNTFRRRGRLIMTLLVLIFGGLIFMTITSIRSSLVQAIDQAFGFWRFDIQLSLERSYRVRELEQLVGKVPGVAAMESWGAATAYRIRPNETESDNIFIFAPNADTQMVAPQLTAGRWLLTADEQAVVLSQNLRRSEPDIQLGDEIRLLINDKESTWRVVGFVQTVGQNQVAFVNYPYFARVLGDVGEARNLQIATRKEAGLTDQQVVDQLTQTFRQAGVRIASVETLATFRTINKTIFDIVIMVLLLMSVLIAVVGALGLMGTMSINVLERTREIGVMRAIGAPTTAILQMVIIEGLLIALISWVIGAVLAAFIGAWLSNTVAVTLLRAAPSYTFDPTGFLLWLLIVLLLAAIASVLPAWNAAQLTVRETLTYE